MVTITASSDFDPELHPTHDDRRKLAIKAGVSSENSLIASSLYQNEQQIHPIRKNINDRVNALQSEVLSIKPNYGRNQSVLDVMVVWTKAAECEAFGRSIGCTLSKESESNMLALINLAIEETNQLQIR